MAVPYWFDKTAYFNNKLEGMKEVLLTESTSSKDERTRNDISFIYENEYKSTLKMLKEVIDSENT